MLLEVVELLGIFVGISFLSILPPENQYVEYIPGNTNLIFSVPHDGNINLTSIPVRKNGCKDSDDVCIYPGKDDCGPEKICKVIIGADLNAKDIARTVFNKYVENTGKTPHLIISHLHRSMLDPNRPVEQAAQGNDEAIAAYEAFHGSIKHAHEALDGNHGLHIDFHGYTDVYRQNNTMIGYLFNSKELNSENIDITKSSIQSLINRTGLPVEQFLNQDNSLGSMFESAGYKAVPSPRQPYPGKDKYYRGGWITQIHGSRDGGVIDAIQLEFPTEIRTEATDEERHTFGVKLAENIERFQSLVNRTGLPVEQFLYGEESLGSMFESAGYKAVPSPRQPYPGKDKYYRGGWITQIHGSRDGGVIDAIQLEFPTEIRTEATDEERNNFGVKLAKNIERFQSLYYASDKTI